MVDKSPRQAFFHLRLHSEFSINDGLVTITSLIEKLKYFGMPAVAITDFANLFALIKFYSAAIKSGIKPICGCDVLVENCDGVRSKIVLLASSNIGYLNLTSLISGIYTEASDARETVISQSKLNKHTEGLIALSGAQYSDVGVALMEGNLEQAEKYLQVWKTMFPNAFYLEVQRLGKVGEEQYIAGLIELAIESKTPVVATNDVRFISQDDFEAHEVRVCINEGRTLDDPRRTRNYTAQQYLKSSTEMSQLFCDLPAAIANTVEIIKRCNLELKLGTPHLPRYPVPEGETLENYLSELSQNGLKKRLEHLYGDEYKTEEILIPYRKRLNQEIEIINRMGFAGYFLIVMEFIQWAKSSEIPVGPGRGSGAGSLVAYALEITDLDPLKYDLLFERFLNPERVSMPDFDIDFCMEGRDRVINHVAELYGKEAVSQIVTFGTMAAKAVVRDVARVQGKPYALADKLSKLIPFEPGMTLSKAFAQEKSLVAFVENDEDAQEIIEMAHKLEGITRNVGKHAGGVVIAPTKLTDFTPLYSDESGQGLVTQFDKNDVETAGLVKFDFLGLRTLTIIDWAVKMINQQRSQEQEPIDISALPLDDESVYELLQSGQTTAVFQLESFGMKELIKRLAPSCFEDIIALVALFRPGPLRSGMDKEFIDRKHGRARVEYLHPELESVLSDTYGVILYQEQVMQIAQVLANYTLGSADILRKAMGKKDEKEMSRQRLDFINGAFNNGIDKNLSGSIFNLMETFAEYGFNKSHSAAYALVSYQTAWLKVHFPAHFMAAVLSADMQNTDKIVTLIDECRSMNLSITPPDVNISQFNFTVNSNGHIVYGLGAIKGLGEGPVQKLIEAREVKNFQNLLDLCQRVDSRTVNKRTMEALIRAGALDNLIDGEIDQARANLSLMLPNVMRAATQRNENLASGAQDLFGDIQETEIGKDVAMVETIPKPWSEKERLSLEKDTLGLYFSGHPIDECLNELSQITRSRLINLRPERGTQLIAGLLHGYRTIRSSKSGQTIAFLTLDDRSARFEVGLYGQEYEKYRELLQKDLILIVECTIGINDSNGGIQGRAKKIMTLHQVRSKFIQKVLINWSENTIQAGFCEQLEAILLPYSYSSDQKIQPNLEERKHNDSHTRDEGCQIAINYRSLCTKGRIELGKEWMVSLNDGLLRKLRDQYGNDMIELEYRKTKTLL